MSKSILMVDTPENCKECDFCYERLCGNGRCTRNKDSGNVVPDEGKPNWCPLREVPEKKFYNECEVSTRTHENKTYYIDGYNTAIDEILGDKN